jgi:hypothetical protein
MTFRITRYYRDRPVIDALTPLDITVTKQDITASKPNDPQNCAYARSIRRDHPGIEDCFVNRSSAFIVYPKAIVRYVLTTSMQKEIVAFDRGGKFAPGEYHLCPPCPAHAPRAKAEYDKARPRSGARVNPRTKGIRS